MTRPAIVAAVTLIISGCSNGRVLPRTPREQQMFGPSLMRLHPTFTAVKDWTGDGKSDGVEAVVELQDSFGEPTRAAGRVMFELFEYRQTDADPRGKRVYQPWSWSLESRDEQTGRWNRAVRGYSFKLPMDAERMKMTSVLTATFHRENGRLFDQIIIGPRPREENQGDRPPATGPAPLFGRTP